MISAFLKSALLSKSSPADVPPTNRPSACTRPHHPAATYHPAAHQPPPVCALELIGKNSANRVPPKTLLMRSLLFRLSISAFNRISIYKSKASYSVNA